MNLDWLKTIAPTIATALGGPIAGTAVAVLGDVLGISEPTKETIAKVLADGKLTPEQLASVKAAELTFKTRLAELGVELENISAKDRDSARTMQINTQSIVPAALATIVVVAWGLIQWYVLTNVVETSMRDLVGRLLGTLDAALMLVLSFYFGSSASSKDKDKLIAALK